MEVLATPGIVFFFFFFLGGGFTCGFREVPG